MPLRRFATVILSEPPRPAGPTLLAAAAALALAAAAWLPLLHFLFRPSPLPPRDRGAIPAAAERLASRQLRMWTDPALLRSELERMRASNAEWDFMGRSFLVWALGEMCLRDPGRAGGWLEVMDRIIAATLETEREKGPHHFLMAYSRDGPFAGGETRSLFLDGEIALMLAVRRIAEEKPDYRPLLRERIDTIVRRMGAGPVLCAESYPDECWMFCNSVALAAVRAADHLDGTDHSEFFRRWLATAKKRLVHPPTGLLVSSYTLAGDVGDGPEGSTIWLAAHCLRLVDEAFARDQYERARKELAGRLCGFGYAREWPASWHGSTDVDSGPIIPVLAISAGSSGLALVGARSFDDGDFLRALWTSLDFAGFPIRRGDALKYGASNQVGDSVMLYALVLGPAWDRILAGKAPEGGGRRR